MRAVAVNRQGEAVEETAGAMLARLGIDAEKWTAEFVKTYYLLMSEGGSEEELLDPAPGGWLFGWFANAIGAGESAGYAQALKDQK